MKRGFSLIEVLVAAVTLVLVITGTAVTFTSIKRLSHRVSYRYSALNIAKDILEFGESAVNITSPFTMRYEYSPGWGDYRVVSATGINPLTQDHPFNPLGDIKQKGLVPRGAPNSVRIFYNVTREALYYYELLHTVRIEWREEPSEPMSNLSLAVVPITSVNNQLQLNVREFWWD